MDKLKATKTMILNKMSELAVPIKQKDLRDYFDSLSEPFVEKLRELNKDKYIKIEKGYLLTGGDMSFTRKGHVAVVKETNVDHEDVALTRLLHSTAFNRIDIES